MDYIIPIPWEHLTKIHIGICLFYIFFTTYAHMRKWISSFLLLVVMIFGITFIPYLTSTLLTVNIPPSIASDLTLTQEWYFVASGVIIGLYMTMYISIYSLSAMTKHCHDKKE